MDIIEGTIGANCDLRITWNDYWGVESPENHLTYIIHMAEESQRVAIKNKLLS